METQAILYILLPSNEATLSIKHAETRHYIYEWTPTNSQFNLLHQREQDIGYHDKEYIHIPTGAVHNRY
jgi:hypothetical protein